MGFEPTVPCGTPDFEGDQHAPARATLRLVAGNRRTDPHRGVAEAHAEGPREQAEKASEKGEAKALAAGVLVLLDRGLIDVARDLLRAWIASR